VSAVAEPVASDVMAAMMGALQPFVPGQIAGLPKPGVTLARAEMRAACIGNFIGTPPIGSIGSVEQHAVRVKALARFSLWGFAAVDTDQAAADLNTAIFAKRTDLAAQGFIKLSLESSPPSEHNKDPAAWRRFADYEMLYEFPYEDVGGAASLILPINAKDTPTAAQWAVTGDLARWDDNAAPVFATRGAATIVGLAALTFIANPADPPTGKVTITRTFDGAPASADAGTLAAFLAQITASPSPARNVFVSFASLSDFLNAFTSDGTSIAMGDNPAKYDSSHLDFPAPLVLASVADRLELSYEHPQFDRSAVVYLRAVRKEAES
jgi:hypothetical protein